jgi:Ribbon-helix-helix protein, copG family
MRINARLDDDTGRKLAYVERETGWSISEIVRRAIDAYYGSFKTVRADAASALRKSGFLGCADGPADLSVTYKGELQRVSDKHGDR